MEALVSLFTVVFSVIRLVIDISMGLVVIYAAILTGTIVIFWDKLDPQQIKDILHRCVEDFIK